MIAELAEKLKKKQMMVSAKQTMPTSLTLTIASEEGKNQLVIEAKEITAEVSKTYIEFTFDKEAFILILQLLEYMAKEMKRSLCFQTTLLEKYTSFSLTTFLEQKKYKVLEGERFEKLNAIEKRHNPMTFMVQSDEGELDSFIEVGPSIDHFMKENNDHELLFLYSKVTNGSYSYYHSGKKERLTLSYEGHEGVYLTVLNEEKKEIKKEKVKNSEEALFFIKNHFSNIKKAQRVKQIVEPSAYFFDKYLNKNAIYGIGKEMPKMIYQQLQRVYTPNQIEEICALHYKNETGQEQFLNSQQRIIVFGEYVVFYDLEKEKVFLTKKDNQSKEKIKQFILSLVETDLDRQIKDIY